MLLAGSKSRGHLKANRTEEINMIEDFKNKKMVEILIQKNIETGKVYLIK